MVDHRQLVADAFGHDVSLLRLLQPLTSADGKDDAGCHAYHEHQRHSQAHKGGAGNAVAPLEFSRIFLDMSFALPQASLALAETDDV